MGYRNLKECVLDLQAHGQLRIIDTEIDPYLEMGMIQRRAYQRKAQALLFTRPKGCSFSMLANLFGTMERVEFIFHDSLAQVKKLFEIAAAPLSIWRKPLVVASLLSHLNHLRPLRKKHATVSSIPVMAQSCKLRDLPHLVSWPNDGGAFITLPLVYSEAPDSPGAGNLGMYRIQISGNDYAEDEVGLHYQLYRGIGPHHAQAIAEGKKLPVHIYVGGPPALSIAAVMPLPANLNELMFAGLLGGRRMELVYPDTQLPVLAQCDFFLQGEIQPQTKDEGPFGDHLGYYSLKHHFPYAKLHHIYHRPDAIWPFTTVGRPPQEDTVFGAFIHELTKPLISKVFEGVKEVHAVDAAGVHPLLLAIGKERYTPYDLCRKPRELLTLAMHLLGNSQTSLAKYLLMIAEEDAPKLSCANVLDFLSQLLRRTDFKRDLHFLTESAADTLDYSGGLLNEGSRLIWAAAGNPIRELGVEIQDLPQLPPAFSDLVLFAPGIVILKGPEHKLGPGQEDERISKDLCQALTAWRQRENFPFLLVVDDPQFCAASLENFLWITFTRSNPATDTYGINAKIQAKHWQCEAPFIIDARKKPFHAPVLEEDAKILKKLESLALRNGPLAGLI